MAEVEVVGDVEEGAGVLVQQLDLEEATLGLKDPSETDDRGAHSGEVPPTGTEQRYRMLDVVLMGLACLCQSCGDDVLCARVRDQDDPALVLTLVAQANLQLATGKQLVDLVTVQGPSARRREVAGVPRRDKPRGQPEMRQ